VFVFATRWDSPDQAKLQELEALGYTVFSVNASSSEHLRHFCMNFATPRAMRPKSPLMVALRREAERTKVIVCLDHAWLAQGYYEDAYGLDWFPQKLSLLLGCGVSIIYLPLDKNGTLEKEARHFLENNNNNRMNIDFQVSDNDNPLHVASVNYCRTLNLEIKHDQNILNGIMNYTKPGRRFIAVSRCTQTHNT
jgi:hypothetical protein